jgi:hypothetical protein
VTRRLQVLFLLALVGVLAALGLVVAELGGPVAVAVYAAVVLGLLVAGAARARAALAPARRPVQHCTCCDGDHTAPVQVV